MDERLRVAVTLEQCWHRVPGGTARSALESLDALLAHADPERIELIGVSARHRHGPGSAWVPPIDVRASRLPRPALYASWNRFRRPTVPALVGPVDVIHATGMAVPPPTSALVVTVHDLAFLRDPSKFTTRGVRFFHRSIELARRDATLIMCPSQATIEECVAAGFDPDRLRLVPWSVEPVEVEPVRVEQLRRSLGIEGPMVLWAGTIEPRKNLPVLLEAFEQLSDRTATLVLAGPQGWNEDLSVRLRALGDRVRVVGFLPSDELRVMQTAADIFCFPSLQEGFGLPVLEAMAQGTAVITSAGTATAEVGADAAVLVDPSDGAALAIALDSLLADPGARDTLAAAGRDRASAVFGRRHHAEQLMAVYSEAAALHGRGS